jgi:hypothetical protein
MVEYLSDNIPECIRGDVAKELTARLAKADVFCHLIEWQEMYNAGWGAAGDEFFKTKAYAKMEFDRIKINNPGNLRSRLNLSKYPTDPNDIVGQYYQILYKLGFKTDGGGSINYNLRYNVIKVLLQELEVVAYRIKVQLGRAYYQPGGRYFVQYGVTSPCPYPTSSLQEDSDGRTAW